jgi:cytochrome P450
MDLKTGQFFHVPHWVLHRAEEHWGSDADSFDPMRKWNDKAFMPFTKAPRDCIGRNFATMEMRCALVALLHYFTFEPVDGADAAPKVGYSGAITLRPEDGLQIKVTIRRPVGGQQS